MVSFDKAMTGNRFIPFRENRGVRAPEYPLTIPERKLGQGLTAGSSSRINSIIKSLFLTIIDIPEGQI